MVRIKGTTALAEAREQNPSLKDLCFPAVVHHHGDSSPTIPFFPCLTEFWLTDQRHLSVNGPKPKYTLICIIIKTSFSTSKPGPVFGVKRPLLCARKTLLPRTPPSAGQGVGLLNIFKRPPWRFTPILLPLC